MREFKTVENSGAVHRVFTDGLLKVNSVDDNKNYRVSLMLLNSKRNRNGWVYENIDQNLNQFVSIPLTCAFFDGKAHGHEFEIKRDPDTGAEYASFLDAKSEHQVGWIERLSPDGQFNAYIENIDGTEWVCIREGYLSLFYNKELIDDLERNGGRQRVSIETLVTKNRTEGDTEYEEEWIVVGVTIIAVTEAVAGANVSRKINAYGEELRKIKMRAAQFYADLNNEPQTQQQKSNKGEKRTMKLRNMEDLKAAFPDYTVIDAKGNSVVLLSDKGRLCSYVFPDDDTTTVASEKIMEVNAVASVGEDDRKVDVVVNSILGAAFAERNAAKSALEANATEIAELKSKIKAMEDKEVERRKKAVGDAIKSRMKERLELYGDRLDEHLCDALLTDEKISEYAKIEDGVEVALRDVSQRCMDKLDEIERAKLKKNASQISWDMPAKRIVGEESEEDGIAKRLQNILK